MNLRSAWVDFGATIPTTLGLLLTAYIFWSPWPNQVDSISNIEKGIYTVFLAVWFGGWILYIDIIFPNWCNPRTLWIAAVALLGAIFPSYYVLGIDKDERF